MRKVIFQMMTTLDGVINNPENFMTDVGDDLYQDISDVYAGLDTLFMGRATYKEMVGYWPGAEADESSPELQRNFARKMNSMKKYVFSTSDDELEWNNSETVRVSGDDDIVAFTDELVAKPGMDIVVAGGTRIAQTFIAHDLIDRYHFFVYPVVLGSGEPWFKRITTKRDLTLISTKGYQNGVVGLYYGK